MPNHQTHTHPGNNERTALVRARSDFPGPSTPSCARPSFALLTGFSPISDARGVESWANQIFRDLAVWLGTTPYNALEWASILVAICQFATLAPICGAFVPNRLGLGGWIRLWPYHRRPLLIYGLVEALLLAATALVLLSTIPKPSSPDPPPTRQDGSPRKSSQATPRMMALMGAALPGLMVIVAGIGVLSGQPRGRIQSHLDRAESRRHADEIVRRLTQSRGWDLIKLWDRDTGTRLWWLGQSMPLSAHPSAETRMATGHLLASPRRSLFLRIKENPTGAALELEVRILDIVLADTKTREADWIENEMVRLESWLQEQGLRDLRIQVHR